MKKYSPQFYRIYLKMQLYNLLTSVNIASQPGMIDSAFQYLKRILILQKQNKSQVKLDLLYKTFMFYQHTYQLNQITIKQEALYGICCLVSNPTEQVIQLRQWLAEQRFAQQQLIQQQIKQQDPLYYVNIVLNGRKLTKQELNIASNSNPTINYLYEIYSTGKLIQPQAQNDEIAKLYSIILKIIQGQAQISQLLGILKDERDQQQQLLNFFIIYLFFLQENANGSQIAANYASYLQQLLSQQLSIQGETIQLVRLLYLSLYLPQQNQLVIIGQILDKQELVQNVIVFQQIINWFDQFTANSQKDKLLQNYINKTLKSALSQNNQQLIQIVLQYTNGQGTENELQTIIQLKIQNLFSNNEQPDIIDIDLSEQMSNKENNKDIILYRDLLEIKREIQEENKIDKKLLMDTIDSCPYLDVVQSLICLILKSGSKIVDIQLEEQDQDKQDDLFNKTNVSIINLEQQEEKDAQMQDISLKLLRKLCLSDLHIQVQGSETQKQLRKLAELQLIQTYSNE